MFSACHKNHRADGLNTSLNAFVAIALIDGICQRDYALTAICAITPQGTLGKSKVKSMNGGLRMVAGNGQRFNVNNVTIPDCDKQPWSGTIINAYVVIQPKNLQFTIKTDKAEENQARIICSLIWKPFAEVVI